MIANLIGKVLSKKEDSLILDVNGVGYEVFLPKNSILKLPEEGQIIALKIYTHVREDALLLYGFLTQLEKDIFLNLISVSGIGPKVALNILSNVSAYDIINYIILEDANMFSKSPGVGKKLAERIIVELKSKINKLTQNITFITKDKINFDTEIVKLATGALLSLGYKKNQIDNVFGSIKIDTYARPEDLIRESLKRLG
jgi:Holliday junction DNA helicase RuvA